MSSLLFLAVVIIAVVAIIGVLNKRHSGKAVDFPYESCQVLFSPAERSFLGVLEQAVGDDFQIFGKVRLNDVIRVQKGLPRAAWQAAYNRIDRKHIDFVICKRDDFSIVAGIELDDKTHARKDRVERDGFLEQAFAATGISLLRFPARKGYVLEEVKSQLSAVCSPSPDIKMAPGGPSEKPVVESDVATQVVVEDQPVEIAAEDPSPASPVCQKCGAEMVKRTASKGKHAGELFLACAGFPKCRNVMPITGG